MVSLRRLCILNVDILLGHDTIFAYSYCRLSEQERLKDYHTSLDLLTVLNENTKLQKQMIELKRKAMDNEFIIRGKLQGKTNRFRRW
jgi:hypothetical protein